MALPHQSIATINSPEFINLQPLDINPLMSACEIKVLYVGENRNRSYISKEVATEMSKTLRGAPIVGYYKKQKQDFADHGQQLIIDDEGFHFKVLTRPYGFVAPDAKVWFQKFEDKDEFGNSIERQYLMTTGYLWTGQFEEAQSVIDEGKPQSMELDEETIDGHWATNYKTDMEFFIINDAIFTKLCILGDDTEPCFEGASVTKPEVSSNFSYDLDENFKRTLFSMIKDLKDALKGGNNVAKEEEKTVETQFEQQNPESSESTVETTFESSESELNEEVKPEETFEKEETQEPEESFVKKDEEDEVKEEDSQEEDSEAADDEDAEEDDDKKKYSLLEQQYEELQTQYTALKEERDALADFKENIENERKDALIAEFYMLSDEDKKDVIENKADYSLEEIKAKLAVICYEKKVNFNSDDSEKIDNTTEEQNEIVTTFTYDDTSSLPDWVKAVQSNTEEN